MTPACAFAASGEKYGMTCATSSADTASAPAPLLLRPERSLEAAYRRSDLFERCRTLMQYVRPSVTMRRDGEMHAPFDRHGCAEGHDHFRL